MFDKNNNINEFDQMIKSILDDGQEDVPAQVWDAVSEGLDNAARRKTVVLWFRRTAIGVAAAAAIALGVIFNITPESSPVQMGSGDGLIAVVGQEDSRSEIPEEQNSVNINALTAVAEAVSPAPSSMKSAIPQTAAEAITISDASPSITEEKTEVQATRPAAVTENKHITAESFPEIWEEEDEDENRNISLMLSGLASTNGTYNQNRIGLMKSHAITSAPTQTCITQTSTKSTYGLPVSFGAGVKIGLSQRWSVGVGANYTILTRQFFGKYTKVEDNGKILPSISSDIRNTQHYIGIPVNAYYDIINKDRVKFYTYAGGTVEKCVADSYKVLSTSIRHNESVKGVQFSVNAGIGVEFMLGRHLGLYIDPSVRYYFDCDQPKSIRTVQPLMLGFEMGFRASL